MRFESWRNNGIVIKRVINWGVKIIKGPEIWV